MVRTGDVAWDIVYLDVAVYEHVAEMPGDPITEFGEKLAHILEGKVRARDCCDAVMLRVEGGAQP